jgi:hypothetical protein
MALAIEALITDGSFLPIPNSASNFSQRSPDVDDLPDGWALEIAAAVVASALRLAGTEFVGESDSCKKPAGTHSMNGRRLMSWAWTDLGARIATRKMADVVNRKTDPC